MSLIRQLLNTYRRLNGSLASQHQVLELRQSVQQEMRGLQQEMAAMRREIAGVGEALAAADHRLQGLMVLGDLYQRDLLLVMDRVAHFIPPPYFQVATDHPVAVASTDHLFPFGTAYDDTRSPRFVTACERVLARSRPLLAMDLGCSGGGLVLDFLLRGHHALGLEGSDFSILAQRAEWRLLRDHLFTCDVTEPFAVKEIATGEPARFDVITAWELMEHIDEEDLPGLLRNVRSDLVEGGLFIGSVATTQSISKDHPGVHYHATVQPKGWWVELFQRAGFCLLERHGFAPLDFCRGVGHWPERGSFLTDPSAGFHFVAAKDPSLQAA